MIRNTRQNYIFSGMYFMVYGSCANPFEKLTDSIHSKKDNE